MSGGDWKEMFKAACEGDMGLLAYHVGSGVDLNYAHPEFLATPLVASILAKQELAALYLLAHGADPHLVSEFDGLRPAQAAQLVGLVAVEHRLSAMGAVATAPPQAQRRWWPRLVERFIFQATTKPASSSVGQQRKTTRAQGDEGAQPADMLAWICRDYGGPEVLALEQRPLPVPGRHQVLVRVEATSVESGDVRVRSRQVPRGFGFISRLVLGWHRPRQPVLGSVLAGTVVAVGPGVRRWAVGNCIVSTTGMAGGAHVTWALLREDAATALRPPGLTPAQAVALVFGGLTAQYFLDRAAVQPRDDLLVIGATGSVGSALVQIAKARGAVVTSLSSASNLALARELGANHAFDYRLHTAARLRVQSFDVVADTCAASSFAACFPVLRAGGRYLNIAGDLPSMLALPREGRRSISGSGRESARDLQRVLDLAAAGLLKPLIDSVWPFAEMPAAHTRAGTGHKRGCVVVQVLPAPAANARDGWWLQAQSIAHHGQTPSSP